MQCTRAARCMTCGMLKGRAGSSALLPRPLLPPRLPLPPSTEGHLPRRQLLPSMMAKACVMRLSSRSGKPMLAWDHTHQGTVLKGTVRQRPTTWCRCCSFQEDAPAILLHLSMRCLMTHLQQQLPRQLQWRWCRRWPCTGCRPPLTLLPRPATASPCSQGLRKSQAWC